MSYEHLSKNMSTEDRKRGRDRGHQVRQEKRHARIAQVQLMISEGLKKSKIAKRLGVSTETIRRDCKTFEESPRSVKTSIVDAVFVVVRNHEAGEIATVDARQQVEDLIGLAVENEARQHEVSRQEVEHLAQAFAEALAEQE